MKDRIKKFANWCGDNVDVLLSTGVVASSVALIAWAVRVQNREVAEWNKAVEAEKKRVNETNRWYAETANAGNDIYSIGDFEFLVLPKDAPREIVLK